MNSLRKLVIRKRRNISEAILDNFDMSAHVEAVIKSIPRDEEGGEDVVGQEDPWNWKLRLKILVSVLVLVIITSVPVVTMGYCFKKSLLIEIDEVFFIAQLLVVPLISVIRVSLA